jgi:serine protease
VPIRLLNAVIAAALLTAVGAAPGGPIPVDRAVAAAPGGRLIVVWKGDRAPSLAIAGVARAHASARSHRSVVTAEPGRVAEVAARLEADSRVAAVIPDAELRLAAFPQTAPNDSLYATYQADLRLINLPAAWPVTIGSGITVAVLDSGLDATHPDLAGMSVVAPHNFVDGSAGFGTNDVTDVLGHGTHVSGTIAARTDNVTGVAGIAPGVSIMPLKVLQDDGRGSFADLADAVDYAVANGADVISMSLGGPLDGSVAAWLQTVMDNARAAGAVVVAAAGNNGTSTPFYPAAIPSVIAVSATDRADDPATRDLKASWSNFGPWIDIAAPGTEIASTLPGGRYGSYSGTSMAAPHVAGIAALAAAAHTGWTPASVEAALLGSATDLGSPGRDDLFGWGRIDAGAAVASGAGPGPTPTPTPTPSVTPTPTPTPTPSPSPSPTPTAAPTEPPSPSPAPTPSVAPTPQPSSAPQPTPSPSPSPSTSPPSLDRAAPVVLAVSPGSRATGVWRGVSPKVTLSEPVRGVSSTTVRLVNTRTGAVVRATVRYDPVRRRVTIDPRWSLMSRTTYRISLRVGIRDLSGNVLRARSFLFTTRR